MEIWRIAAFKSDEWLFYIYIETLDIHLQLSFFFSGFSNGVNIWTYEWVNKRITLIEVKLQPECPWKQPLPPPSSFRWRKLSLRCNCCPPLKTMLNFRFLYIHSFMNYLNLHLFQLILSIFQSIVHSFINLIHEVNLLIKYPEKLTNPFFLVFTYFWTLSHLWLPISIQFDDAFSKYIK